MVWRREIGELPLAALENAEEILLTTLRVSDDDEEEEKDAASDELLPGDGLYMHVNRFTLHRGDDYDGDKLMCGRFCGSGGSYKQLWHFPLAQNRCGKCFPQ